MKEIIFATSNSGKIATLTRHFEIEGLDIAIRQQPLELIEPQANTATEVALSKARQAYEQLSQPILVDDSSFHIEALGGFPGPYVKYMIDSIGAEGIMKFMQGQSNRRAYFTTTLVFTDTHGQPFTFEDRGEGEIVETIDPNDHTEAWSELWKIFAPQGRGGKTYSQLSPEELRAHRAGQNNSAYAQFARWLNAPDLR